MRRRFKIGIVVVLFLFFINLPISVFSQTLPETVISVEPSSSTVQTCSNQVIAIQVQDVVDLTGYHLEISYDPDAIQVTDIVNGGFLDDALENAFYEPTNEIDNVNGKIVFGMVQQNDSGFTMTPKTGTGDLILITFEAVTWNQTTTITIDPLSSMLVDWPDAFEIPFTVVNGTVSTESCAPTDIMLSNDTIPENESVGTMVGTLSASDPDAGDSFTFSLVDAATYPDNSSFLIAGNVLQTNTVFNYEVKSTYTIKIRVADSGGETYDEVFTIHITDVNDPPVALPLEIEVHQGDSVEFTVSCYDEDGDSFSYVLATTPDYGTLPWTPPDLTYTADINYQGLDYFDFQCIDIHDLAGNIARVNITVLPKEKRYFPVFFYRSN